ncbi:MAG: septum formation initiator family protein [Alicyclobacillaceae bacterium]|nr:septum formation initiator family protein [Alicyclobacillaceae bacterium]
MAAVKPMRHATQKPKTRLEAGRARLPRLSPEQVRDRLALVGVLVAGIGILCWVLSRNAMIAAQNYQLEALRDKLAAVQQENSVLQSKVEQLSTPSRVVEIAKKMGLTYAKPEQWRTLPGAPGGNGR